MQVSPHSNNFFLSLLENSTDLISIVDEAGNYIFVGGSVKHLLGYEAAELVGTHAFDYIHEEDKGFAAEALGNALEQRVAVIPYFRFRNKQGDWRWLECTITNMLGNVDIQGYVTNSRDVTERVEEERRKKKSQAHFESLFYNHPDAVFELDRQGLFYLINRQVSAITGYADADLLGTNLRHLIHPKDLPQAGRAFANALQGRSSYLELLIIRKDGTQANLGVTVVPVFLGQQVESIQCIAKDITLIREYDNLIKERAEQLNSIMERIPESFFSLDRNWNFTYANAFYTSYVGVKKEDLIGRNMLELYPMLADTHFFRECQRVAETGIPVSFEELFIHRQAKLYCQLFPSDKGVSVHFVDITEQSRQQQRLQRLSLVASKTRTGVLIIDRDGRIEWVNEAFEQAMGYTLEEIYRQYPIDYFVGPETLGRTLNKIQKAIAQGKDFKGEVLNYTRDGRKIWFYLEITPVFDEAGQLLQFVCIRTDITEKKNKEEELVQVTRDLFKQNRDLQHFSYMVSHNLRAPAANVMGLTDILALVDKNSPLFEETVQRLKVSSQGLDQVIRDMNHILSIRENNLSFIQEEVMLDQVCQEALHMLNYKLKELRHHISLHLDKNIGLLANKNYLFEIFKNLLSNSIKFRTKDEVLRLEVTTRRQADSVYLEIRDNGIGMDLPTVRKDLFKLYSRFHPGYEGRGIGLFLVKTYVDALGGSIQVSSTPGQGTCFKIKFKCLVAQSLCILP